MALLLLIIFGLGVVIIGTVLAVRWQTEDEPVTTPPLANAVDLKAPMAGPEKPNGPWIRLSIEPAKAGENDITERVVNAEGALVPQAGTAPPVTLSFTNLEQQSTSDEVSLELDESGTVVLEDQELRDNGWWRIEVTARPPDGPEVTIPFYAILPDPNINGTDAIPTVDSTTAASAVYDRGLASMTGLHRVRFRQSMADGKANVAFSEHAINDGSDGQPPAFHYRALGGLEAYVVGNYRWMRQPGELWTEDGSSPMIPPAE